MLNKTEITHVELRRIVIALHTCGTRLKIEPGLFSHADVGREYLELAARIDRLAQSRAEGRTLNIKDTL